MRWLLLVVVAAGCGRGGRGGDGPWEPGTTTFDPECARCEVVGEGALAHLGDVQVMIDPGLDDPEAQWVTCLNGFMDCLDASGDDFDGCMASSTCPEPCKQDYAERAEGATAIGKLEAVEAVFVAPDGRCASPRGVEPEVRP